MRSGWRRGCALLACRALQAVLPARLRSWGWAIRSEVAEIADDTEACLFALHSLCGIAPRIMAKIMAGHLLRPFVVLSGHDALSSRGTANVRFFESALRHPRSLGIACAAGAALLGLAYLAMAGAPMSYLGINAGALIVGLAMLALVGRITPESGRWPGALTLTTAMILLLTALLGDQADGAARWVAFGGLFIQPSLVLLPLTIVGFARSRHPLALAGMVIAAAALAIQPDRAMAGVLVAGLAVLSVMRPDRWVIPALAASIAGFAVTLVRADTLPAAPYVDQVLYSSFQIHALAGLAVLAGSALLLVPAIVGGLFDVDNREAYPVFGAVWLAALLSAALGNYPTPVVGYGGSAVLGYLLSLTALPKAARSHRDARAASRADAENRDLDRHPYVGAAQAT